MKWLRLVLQLVGILAILLLLLNIADSYFDRHAVEIEIAVEGPPAVEAAFVSCHDRTPINRSSTGFHGRARASCDAGGIVLVRYADKVVIPCEIGYLMDSWDAPAVQTFRFKIDSNRRTCEELG